MPRPTATTLYASLPILLLLGCDGDPTRLDPPALEVRVRTIGETADLDVDGYSLVVDGRTVRTVTPNATVLVDDLEPGEHTVIISGVESNCAHTGPNPQFVSLARGKATTVDFALACVPRRGALRVAVTTTGSGSDPDGYVLRVLAIPDSGADFVFSGRTAVNDEVVIEDIPAGPLEVRLDDLHAGCTATGGNPRHTQIEHGEVRAIGFDVSCPALVDLEIAISTTGVHPQPEGYRVVAHGPGGPWSVAAPEEGVVRIEGLVPGQYQVYLHGADPSCDAEGNPRGVDGASGGPRALSFEVVCAAPREFAYVSTAEPDTEIYTARDDGTGILRLTDNDAADDDPAWSPDGARIAFTTDRDGNREIYLMNADGSGLVRLTDDPAADRQPALSPDGTRILFVSDRDGDPEIYALSLEDGAVARLTVDPGIDESPAWSPGGTEIAFIRNDQLHVMAADGSGVRAITDYYYYYYYKYESDPAWSPDGTGIAFGIIWCYYGCGSPSIDRVRPDGTDWITMVSGVAATEPAWYPDGAKLAFTQDLCDPIMPAHCTRRLSLVRPGIETLTLVDDFARSLAWRPAP